MVSFHQPNALGSGELLEMVDRELQEAKLKAEVLRQQIEVAQQRVASLEVTHRELTRLIGAQPYGKRGALRSDSGTLVHGDVSGKGPSLSEAIQIVMQTRPVHAWNAAEIEVELTSRGWMPSGTKPVATLRAAVFRLNKGGLIDNVERGRYRLASGQASSESTPHHEPAYVETLKTREGGGAYPLAM